MKEASLARRIAFVTAATVGFVAPPVALGMALYQTVDMPACADPAPTKPVAEITAAECAKQAIDAAEKRAAVTLSGAIAGLIPPVGTIFVRRIRSQERTR